MEIFAAQGAPPVWLTPEENGKNLQSENVFIIFLHLWEVELTYKCQQSDFVLIGVIDTGGKFATGDRGLGEDDS